MSDSKITSANATVQGSKKLWIIGVVLLVLGHFLVIPGAADEANHPRLAHGIMWAFSIAWTITLGCFFWMVLHYITHSVWSLYFRRIMEWFSSTMPSVLILFVPVMIIAWKFYDIGLFPWLVHGEEHNPIVDGKSPYLNLGFFTIRSAIYFIFWIGTAFYFIRGSLKQDKIAPDAGITLKRRKISGPVMVLFMITLTFAGIDWLMSLNPLWFSTIFGIYMFSGMAVSGIAMVTLAYLILEKNGRIPEGLIRADHRYSLGAWQFAFSCFWAYISFSQYMLIWYANLPEENFYIYDRLQGGWSTVSVLLVMVRFILPFFLLLSRNAKTSKSILWITSPLIILGQIIDMYWLIMPEVHKAAPALGLHEIAPVILGTGGYILALARFMKKNPMVPQNDPQDKEAQCFHL